MKRQISKTALLISLLVLLSTSLKATHYMGGEITWKCLSNGKYIFYLKIFRECHGASFSNLQSISSNSPAGSINVTIISGYPKDISPVCNPDSNYTHLSCFGATTSSTGAVSEFYYKSSEITLNGIPPASGWSFYWGSCCRSSSTNIIGQPSWRLLSKMYPYGNQNTYPCFDNSPYFAAPPATVISNGFNSLCSFTGIDADNDNLIYGWDTPLFSTGLPLTVYTANYSYTNPFPDTSQNNSNIPATLDTTTGMITLTSYTTGSFISKVKVKSYRNGIKIAEVSRETQVIIKNDVNSAPNFTNFPAPNNQIIQDTLLIGDSIMHNINVYDYQTLPNSSSWQTVFLERYGTEFGDFVPSTSSSQATLNPNNGCINPPCATLTPAWDSIPLNSINSTSTNFKWVTNISHLDSSSSGYRAKTYNFYFRAHDDFCPIPSERSLVISVYVTTGNIFQKPTIKCIETKQNGDVVLKFNPVKDDFNSFEKYYIYSATSKSNPFNIIDSITNHNIGTYTHIGAGADTLRRFYIISVKSSNSSTNTNHTEYSDTISTMNINAYNPNNCSIFLSWNPPHPFITGSPNNWYKVYRKISPGNWTLIDTTSNAFYLDISINFNMALQYKVSFASHGLKDSLGNTFTCNSWTNTLNTSLPNFTLESPKIRMVDVLLNGDVKLTWYSYNDFTNGFKYYELFSSNSKSGPYTSVMKIYNKNTKTTTHSGAWASSNKRYYYLKVKSADCLNNNLVIPPIDTVSTIFVNTYVTSLNNVKLTWNSIRKNKLPTTYKYFFIYEKHFPGNWILIDSTLNKYYHTSIQNGIKAYRISSKNIDPSQSITVREGFSNQSDIIFLNTTEKSHQNFEVYQNIPNPFSNKTIIKYRIPKDQNIVFTVYDSNGKEIVSRIIEAKKGENQFEFSREKLSAGVYFYKLDDGNSPITKRFIVK